MKKLSILLSIILVLTFFACDNIFSTSWGVGFARKFDSSNITVTEDNVDDWVTRGMVNSELAFAVTESIIGKLDEGGLSSSEELALINGGVKLSVEASGIGVSIVTNALGLVESLSEIEDWEDGIDMISDILGGIQSDFISNNGELAADNLAVIIGHAMDPSPNTLQNGQAPYLDISYSDNANANDVGFAMLVLVLGVIEELPDFDFDFDDEDADFTSIIDEFVGFDFGDDNKIIVTDIDNVSPKMLALAAIVNSIGTSENLQSGMITGPIFAAFGGEE